MMTCVPVKCLMGSSRCEKPRIFEKAEIKEFASKGSAARLQRDET